MLRRNGKLRQSWLPGWRLRFLLSGRRHDRRRYAHVGRRLLWRRRRRRCHLLLPARRRGDRPLRDAGTATLGVLCKLDPLENTPFGQRDKTRLHFLDDDTGRDLLANLERLRRLVVGNNYGD